MQQEDAKATKQRGQNKKGKTEQKPETGKTKRKDQLSKQNPKTRTKRNNRRKPRATKTAPKSNINSDPKREYPHFYSNQSSPINQLESWTFSSYKRQPFLSKNEDEKSPNFSCKIFHVKLPWNFPFLSSYRKVCGL